jgi:hypothetical protein
MIRYPAFSIGLAGLVLATGLALAAGCGHRHEGPVYSVADLRAHLADNPGAWLGRTVWVRGVAGTCLDAARQGGKVLGCRNWPPDLSDPASVGARVSLPLVWGSQDPLLALLRRVPLLSGSVPAAPAPLWWMPATYRVQLRAAADYICGTTPCYEALLLDTAP